MTADLDICYSRAKENLKRLAAALAPFNPSLRGAPIDLPFRLDVDSLNSGLNFTLATDLGDLDILGEVTGLGGYPSVLTFSEELEIFGMRCKVLTLEALITSKRAVSRAKDLLLLPELEALLEIAILRKRTRSYFLPFYVSPRNLFHPDVFWLPKPLARIESKTYWMFFPAIARGRLSPLSRCNYDSE